MFLLQTGAYCIMMKETNFGPLLLLLLLAVTPRNSSANPIASPDGLVDGALVYFSSEIENDMKTGADILTEAMTWLQNNALNSQFDISILDMQEKIKLLPARLAPKRVDILEGLLKSNDRLKQLRNQLEQVARTLRDYCVDLIRQYETDQIDSGLLKHTAGNFAEYAEIVNVALKLALKETEEIQDILSESKALLIDFKARLYQEKQEILDKKTDAENIKKLKNKLNNEKQAVETIINEDTRYTHTQKLTIISCIFDLVFECEITNVITNSNMQVTVHGSNELGHTIAILSSNMQVAVNDRKELDHTNDIQNERQIRMDSKREELLNLIMPAHKSAETLLCNVEDVKVYLTTEICLITAWRIRLKATILDNKDLEDADIKYSITGIKGRLNVLMKACEDYIAHKLPEKLSSFSFIPKTDFIRSTLC